MDPGDLNQIDWLSKAVVAVAGVGALFAAARRLVMTIRQIAWFLDDWFGEPAREGQPARPGVMERLEALEKAVADLPQTEANEAGS